MTHVAAMLLALGVFAGPAEIDQRGQKFEPVERHTFFRSMEACKEAYNSGAYRSYIPAGENMKKGTHPAAKGTPVALCALETVREAPGDFPDLRPGLRGKQAYVVLEIGTPVVYNDAGRVVMDGRCWNDTPEVEELPLRKGEPGPPGPMGPQGPKGDKGDKGDQGEPGKVVYVDNAPYEQPEPEEGGLWWGATAGVIPQFSSVGPVGDIVANFSGRELCEIKGSAFDVGVAFGEESWFGRLTFMVKPIKNGSSTIFNCTECDAEVVTEANGMNVMGANFELVKQFTDWPVKPTITGNIGLGYVSGKATRRTIMGSKMEVEEVEASELLGSSWLLGGGFSAGVSGNIGDRFIVGATVGVEYPGFYPVRVFGIWKF